MKFKLIFVVALVAALALGLALSAQATVIGPAPTGEANLWDIVSGWTSTSISQNDLQNASTQATLPAGSYTLLDWASYAGFSQELTVPTKTLASTPPNNVNKTGVNIAFTEANAFAFKDLAKGDIKLATDGTGDTDRLQGLIINLGAFGLQGHYLVAFEDGATNKVDGVYIGDRDYNDMVAHVVPLPGAVLLLGAGLARLAAHARRRQA